MKLTSLQATILALSLMITFGFGVFDFMDGPVSSPNPYLLFAVFAIAGYAVGIRPPRGPWS